MKKFAVIAALFFVITAVPAAAHFGMIIPSDSMVMQGEDYSVKLEVSFSHPFENVGMDMEMPDKAGVFNRGKINDIVKSFKPATIMGKQGWEADYKINTPAVHIFYVQPKPYWEPAEDCFIIHYTKTVVASFGADEGWDKELGLETEIVPLSRPFGLYAGNIFQGIVKAKGKKVPFAFVEVEYYNNREPAAEAPNDYMITQTLKADENGVFTFSVPAAGWWGFAALTEADYKLKHQGQDKDVELGAVLWVEFQDWK